mmetsp:Transcript_18390/g.60390  ORF Transcript_18390/g.60390 Transcript_18390/m.60390 type:complete len:163 (-) Transcript_18390:135-623(-)
MSQDEMMELLGMTKIHAWRVSRCKDVTDGTRRWSSQGQQAQASPQASAPSPSPSPPPPPPPPPPPAPASAPPPSSSQGRQQQTRRGSSCRFGEDLTGKRCFGLTRAPDPAWTPASCKDQCCRRSDECGLWLYSYAEGCWFGKPGQDYNCRDEAGWFGGKGIV